MNWRGNGSRQAGRQAKHCRSIILFGFSVVGSCVRVHDPLKSGHLIGQEIPGEEDLK